MKRVLIFILAAVLLLSGCSRADSDPPVTDPGPLSADGLLTQLLAAVPEGSEVTAPTSPEEVTASLLLYGIDPATVKGCAIARLGGARVFEIAVIDLTESSGAAAEALLDYLVQRQGAFTGYAPDQADLAAEGEVYASADTLRLVLAITEGIREVTDTLNAAGFLRVFRASDLPESIRPIFPSPSPEPSITPTPTPEPSPELTPEPTTVPTPTPTPEPSAEPSPGPSDSPAPAPSSKLPWFYQTYDPPNTDDMSIYDTSAILAAWETGSAEGLPRKDKWVYERCVELVGQLISEDMSDYEKEWAVYSWLVSRVNYDYRHQDSFKTTPRDSFRPYGALVNGTAVCLGYATTFQLFMDLLDIECITVVGAAFSSTGDHAWNMVKLNGEWYCVDATWDLGNGSNPQRCNYFNVTSDHMAKSDHQWDYENTPMATATDGGNP